MSKMWQNSLRTVPVVSHGYSKTANKILGKLKQFCASQICTQKCHIPIFLTAKYRKLENQVRKRQNHSAAVIVAHTQKNVTSSAQNPEGCIKHIAGWHVTSILIFSHVLVLDIGKVSPRSCWTQIVKIHSVAARSLFSAQQTIQIYYAFTRQTALNNTWLEIRCQITFLLLTAASCRLPRGLT